MRAGVYGGRLLFLQHQGPPLPLQHLLRTGVHAMGHGSNMSDNECVDAGGRVASDEGARCAAPRCPLHLCDIARLQPPGPRARTVRRLQAPCSPAAAARRAHARPLPAPTVPCPSPQVIAKEKQRNLEGEACSAGWACPPPQITRIHLKCTTHPPARQAACTRLCRGTLAGTQLWPVTQKPSCAQRSAGGRGQGPG